MAETRDPFIRVRVTDLDSASALPETFSWMKRGAVLSLTLDGNLVTFGEVDQVRFVDGGIELSVKRPDVPRVALDMSDDPPLTPLEPEDEP